ncbi:glycerol-3-phosphate dehydrogenase [Thiotrichales bacterium 19S9-12]|nr:glycerol-3-phosphate dehydrogenase [Thiotrichales bacterium 19S9-11]MCF6812485.1 glycerol-3-phosphate dehydrogenase [Thiotrichales bacterium 19S9-12]
MSQQINKTMETDLVVIGGGINGTGIACDAQGRGLNVILCEAKDLASATSRWSSKLVHGGLRYLEQYEFKLVKEALNEREILLHKAPHIIQPLSFILPYDAHLRPKWMIKIGLFLYDHLTKLKSLDKSKGFSLKNTPEAYNLKDHYTYAFRYSDCRIDDARMVILNAKQAQSLGAKILLNSPCIGAERKSDHWHVTLQSPNGLINIKAKGVINATGPWVADILKSDINSQSKNSVRLVQGSHIVVPKLYEGNHAYILQNKDNRIVFAIPYGFTQVGKNDFTLIGTTDVNYHGDPREVKITTTEKEYLCEIINEYFKTPITPSDIIWEYSGVRPLYDDHTTNASKVTREYHLELEDHQNKLPLLSVFGGKITTFRTLSEHVLEELDPYFDHIGGPWTAKTKSPGGDGKSLMNIFSKVKTHYPWLDDQHAYRYTATYGTETFDLLKNTNSISDLGEHFGLNLYEKELDYLVNYEWAFDLDGIIWIRTKLGLWLTDKEKQKIQAWLDKKII